MIIEIDDKYRLEGKEDSWAFQKLDIDKNGVPVKDDKGNLVWRSFKWWGDIEMALNRVAEYRLRTSNAKTLADGLKEIKDLASKIRAQIEIA